MANLEIEGRIVRFLAPQSGSSARGEWAKQEFVVEYQDGNFPTTVVFNVWGADKVQDLKRYKTGDEVKVSFRPSSREFNGKFYTDLRAWRISPAGGSAPEGPAAYASEGFAPSYPQAPAPSLDDMPAPSLDKDDLPF
ncbi:MAG: DUF3127 domain-containing protein [Bacteroidales bacterium]|nr:DUF3127 domain-containing protein [Bacteroidales bacterium]